MSLVKIDGNNFTLNVPLVKYNEATGEFEGWATVEELDRSGETIDLEKSWPYFEKWSQKFAKATNGESFGNVREQHDERKAAGKLTSISREIHPSRAAGIYVKGVAVDPITKEKLAKRVLVGLSIGGKYVEKDKETGSYVADPSELSLVDNPCVENAMITVVKADGREEIAKAVGYNPPQGFLCRAGQFHTAKADARHCFDHTVEKDAPDEEAFEQVVLGDDIKKSLYCVARLTDAILTLTNVAADLEHEDNYQQDDADTEMSDNISGIVQQLYDALVAIAQHEADEFAAGDEEDGEASAPSPSALYAAITASLTKSEEINNVIKSLHVRSTGNESSSTDTTSKENDMEKTEKKGASASAATADEGTIAKSLGDVTKSLGDLTKAVTSMNEAITADRERVATIEKTVTDTRAEFTKDITALSSAMAKTLALVTGVKAEDDSDLESVFKAIAGKPAASKAAVRAVKKSDETAVEVEGEKPKKSGNPLIDDAKLIATF